MNHQPVNPAPDVHCRPALRRSPTAVVALTALFPLLSLCSLLPSAAAAQTTHSVPAAASVQIQSKVVAGQTDKVFADTLGREVSFRGFNVSGEAKLLESGFRAFKTTDDARDSLSRMRRQTGANLIRYTLAWEGVQPQPWTVDEAYLASVTGQIAVAADLGIYVLLDYHSDLYSRHTFTVDSGNTGNGAPAWAVSDVYGKDDCGLPCQLTWAAHKQSDSAVRNAIRGFWYDHWALDQTLNDIELLNPAAGVCLDVSGADAANSTAVIGYACHDGANQRWQYRQDGTLRTALNTDFCLDVADADGSAGTAVRLYQCNGSQAQQFMADREGRLHSLLDLNLCVALNSSLALADCAFTGSSALAAQQWLIREGDNHAAAELTYVQSQFVWQLGEMLEYLSLHLTAEQRRFVLGVDPINEPFDGGIGAMTYADWDNQLLWPFYQRVRAEMDARGWNGTPVFAEPNVFWSSIAGVVAPATGGHYLSYQPGDGFVFNSHFYDQGRMGTNDLSVARNGSYFDNLNLIRDEARYLNIAPFLSEFGMWLDGYGHTDTERVVNGTYQALESSDRAQSQNRYVDFYTPLISGSQWQWDYYYDNHYEYQNGNSSELKTTDDAWNGENFSVVADYGQSYNVAPELVQRAYPRAVQGKVLHFAYEGLVPDEAGDVMSWHSIRASLPGVFTDREFFRDTAFAFLAWQGRQSDAPTEIYWPAHYDIADLLVITDAGLFAAADLPSVPAQDADEVVRIADAGSDSGNRILIWDDVSAAEDSGSVHFALLVNGAGLSHDEELQLQAAVRASLSSGQSPVYLTGSMTHSGYDDDKGTSASGFALVNNDTGLCLDVAGGWTWNGTNVQSYTCNGSKAQRWYYDASTGYLRSALNTGKCLDNGGQMFDGGKAVLWSCNGNNMRWDRSGNRLLPRLNAGFALTADGSSASSDVRVRTGSASVRQQWTQRF
ncbi:ricin-type beta-trefoil lectin domain protein [Thalassolituus sp. LLYu03]|uniref:ricin-type beta-trefoil lectin domain protein n=1 Tax=Thalassolituus sp. LLYu03 TaxID=3421656 RepID=UPI003D282381